MAYLLALLVAAVASIWAVARVIIPRLVESNLEAKYDSRKHRQSTENRAVDLMHEIMREAISERSQEIDDLRKAVERQSRIIDGFSQALRTLTGLINERMGTNKTEI